MKRWAALLPLVVLLLLAAAFWRGLGRDPTFVPSPLVGAPAPAFDLPSLHDPAQRVTSGSLRGAVTLVNVWGSWCGGCRQEHALLLELAAKGVRIVGIDWKDDPVNGLAWLKELGNPYAVVGADLDGRVAIDWGVYGAPETFVVDKAGRIRDKVTGPMDQRLVEAKLLPLLAQLDAEPAP